MGEDAITGHYRRAGLEEEILAALRESGLAASVDTLAPVDEFHTGGRRMTASLVDRLDLHPGSRVLDVGCGIGGTARYIAATRGAEVTGIDLTPEYVAAARALTEKAGPAGLVRFDRGDGTDLPYPDGSFDAACAIHTGMNIERKDLLAAGLARVLRAGGRLAVFDIMRTGDGEVGHPTPWAATAATSFLADPRSYRGLLEEAGFEVVHERDWSAAVLDALRRGPERAPAGGAPPLGPHLLMGERAEEKRANVNDAVRRGIVAPVEMIAVAPGP
ncbi:class I SAM-dependent methyltransferase [Nocardiopsis composta]|uniref:Ubiquinone/menaquinone biosynthesis C-methylase UbiE n=1 Tax=Nocardiopsis composta TaxID=157465 RepID=A0A7W8QTJ9_9ACTN|nr:methyltransferase domain-containing protein [Nocardiopsis composta]MBB5436186.1 ubiquinone/menaquinone biosynthesis C-methylase UbiE [Nocardiopsis composta]